MQFIKKIIIALTLLISLITFAQSETTWITKKKDKSKKIEKVEKKETTSSWIKKKDKSKKIEKVKKKETWIKKTNENKEKFKENEKESTTWISKKSKKEKKLEKKVLKKYIEIADLPKANFYFTGRSDNGLMIYGYVNADKKSDLIDINGESYFSISKGYAYLDDSKTSCLVDSQLASLFGKLAGKVRVECANKLIFNGKFFQESIDGLGQGETNEGNIINFKFTQFKNKNLAYFKDYKEQNIRPPGQPPTEKEEFDINPNGKYYALLIGNSDYSKSKWSSLKSPVNDVMAIAKILKSNYNFKNIEVLKDAKRHEIFEKLVNLRKIVTSEDYLLIYYSGHGDQDSDDAFWIPVNAVSKEWDNNWINVVTIRNAIKKIQTKHTLLMMDSCWVGTSFMGKGNNNNNVDNEYSSSNYKIVKKALGNRAGIVISSGSTTSVLDTAVDDKHSLFAYKFIDILKKNKTFVTSRKIWVELEDYHGAVKQTPQRYLVNSWGHLDGDFVFIPKKK